MSEWRDDKKLLFQSTFIFSIAIRFIDNHNNNGNYNQNPTL